MIRRYLPRSVQELVHWYERYVSPLSLVAGFLADNFILLRRVDLPRSNLLLFSYLCVAASGIAAMQLIESGRLRRQWILSAAPFIPVVVQFAFGGLLSGYLSLYSRSAALSVSLIFVAAIAALLLSNERFTRFYGRFSFQIGLYFTVLFSFLIFFLPVVFRAIGPWMFMLSGAASLLLMTLYLILLKRLIPEIVARNQTVIARTIAAIFVIFNVLYFAGAIPPLPLSLKDAGVYHGVVRQSDGSYQLLAEPLPWYEAYFRYNTVFHHVAGGKVYAWSAVFAPSGLSTTILHQWQRYDENAKTWVTTDTLRFSITGGRDGGFRGYSIKTGVTPGSWRVNVITQYGQLIGRISFSAVEVPAEPPLQSVSR